VTEPEPPEDTSPADGFRSSLNEHGHGFHHAVVKHVEEIRARRRIRWKVVEVEFPVEQHRGKSTRIDCVLRHLDGTGNLLYAVAECKRANPALSSWCFIRRAPQQPRDQREVIVETVNSGLMASAIVRAFEPSPLWPSPQVYDLALPVRHRSAKGDAHGEGREVIEAAINQAILRIAGLAEFLSDWQHRTLLKEQRPNQYSARLLPVVFTTARLWTTDAALNDADLLSGNLPETPLSEVRWLWLEHVISPGFRHDLLPGGPSGSMTELSHYLRRDYVRHVAIVTAAGIEEFLSLSYWADGP
jgi:hypothetical protein